MRAPHPMHLSVHADRQPYGPDTGAAAWCNRLLQGTLAQCLHAKRAGHAGAAGHCLAPATGCSLRRLVAAHAPQLGPLGKHGDDLGAHPRLPLLLPQDDLHQATVGGSRRKNPQPMRWQRPPHAAQECSTAARCTGSGSSGCRAPQPRPTGTFLEAISQSPSIHPSIGGSPSGGCGTAGAAPSGRGRAWRCASGGSRCPPRPRLRGWARGSIQAGSSLARNALACCCAGAVMPHNGPGVVAPLHALAGGRGHPSMRWRGAMAPRHALAPCPAEGRGPSRGSPTRRRSGCSPWLLTAFALADCSALCTSLAAFLGETAHCGGWAGGSGVGGCWRVGLWWGAESGGDGDFYFLF